VLTDPAAPSLGILLSYPERPGRSATTIGLGADATPATDAAADRGTDAAATDRGTDGATDRGTDAAATRPRAVSLVGAGSFATRVLVPALVADGRLRLDTVVTRAGAAAGHVGRRAGFARAASDPAAAFDPARVGAAVIATRHDSHPDLVAQALQAGLAVLVEKPLAVDEAGLGRVLRAWRQHPGALLVGFNRRFAAPVRALLAALPARTAPGMVAIRVAAARLDPHHWAQDEREGGGRIAGELCHFVDLAAHLLGQAPAGVYARRADGRGPRLANHVAVLLDFPDGSTAALQYHALGGAGMPKELVEAAWDGASGQIDDFKLTRTWTGGRPRVRRWRRQDKGHRAEVAAFVDWVCGGQPAWDPRDGLLATAATLAVLRSLAAGERIEVAAVLDAAAAAGVDGGWA
jgi:predicted dehydrogenase